MVFTLTNQSSWGGQGLADLAWRRDGEFWSLCLEGEKDRGMQGYKTSPGTSDIKNSVRNVLFEFLAYRSPHRQDQSLTDGARRVRNLIYTGSRRAWSRCQLLRQFNWSLKRTQKLWPSIHIIKAMATRQGRSCHQVNPFLFPQHFEKTPWLS